MASNAREAALREEVQKLRAAGDTMQSDLSRILEFVKRLDDDKIIVIPYEVLLAEISGERMVEEWTEVRRKSKPL